MKKGMVPSESTPPLTLQHITQGKKIYLLDRSRFGHRITPVSHGPRSIDEISAQEYEDLATRNYIADLWKIHEKLEVKKYHYDN